MGEQVLCFIRENAVDFIKLAHRDDFIDNWIKSYQILGKFIAIVKEKDGTFYATEIACKHNNADLTTGDFRGSIVRCCRHGWEYDIKSGECLNHDSAPLRRHELKIEDDDLYVSVSPIDADGIPEEDFDMPEIVINNPPE